ncbi:hypothetical protein [Burkholderia vietnamiensis]|uniref:hypothetical protein n=1 Tax=Burkholderia vietnamiensis TaxID=60552 RepID=UPI001FC9E835|nr:hypothetical protein [Burkholderia vietnamiensis]MDN7814692.1 hypothetical protein [Burkholderia vietnamiensis]MDN8042362.1 hypothetical protein [Burkholderia vietnamiensis]
MTYLSNAAMDKAIKSITARGVKLQNDIQQVGLSAINAVAEHGNTFYVNKLFIAVRELKGSRSAALAEWFLLYGKVKANTDPKTKLDTPFVFDREGAADLEEAALNPWHSLGKKERNPDELFDVNGAVRSLLSKIKKAGAKTNNPELTKALLAVGDLVKSEDAKSKA